MADNTIRAGDLVIVVGSCCGKSDTLGLIRTVRAVDDDGAMCPGCGRLHVTRVAHLGDDVMRGWVPVAWLKKIDPWAEPESIHVATERKDRVPA